MNNKYLLSVFLCLLSATAAKASPKHHQSNASDKQAEFESDQTNKNQIKLKIDLTKQTWLGSWIETQQPDLLLTKWLPSVKTTKYSIYPNTQNQGLQIGSPPSRENNRDGVSYHTTAVSLTNQPIKVSNNLIAQDPLGQVNRVSQLKQLNDVSPDDWAYEALRSLSERYNCISGFEDGTFRGQETLTRYEFAAGLDSCLQKIESLIAEQQTVVPEDLETVGRLSQEFEAELANLSGKVDSLETRIESIEDNQFSTTTILNGEAIFTIADAFGGNPPGGCTVLQNISDTDASNVADCVNTSEPDTETTFTHTTRLGLQSSFTGQDRLRLFLTSGNFNNGGFTNPESLNTYMARLGSQAGLENDVFLDIVEYRFPVANDKLVLYGAANGFALSNVLTANSPFFDIGRGSISRFGQLNPILRIGGAMDAGVGFDWSIIDGVRLQTAYGTRDSGDPNNGGGFFGADHSALGVQLLAQPTESVVAGLNYVNAYSSDGSLGTFTGSVNAETGGLWSDARIPAPAEAENDPTFNPCCRFFLGDQPAQINAFGGSVQWNATEKINLAAWGGYTFTDFRNELPDFDTPFAIANPLDNGIGDAAGEKPFADSATFTLSFGLSDPLGREGDLLGFIFGMPPKLVNAGPEARGTAVPFFEQVIDNEGNTVVTDNNPNLDTLGQIQQRINETGATFEQAVTDLVAEDVLPTSLGEEDEATSLHFELFYRFKVNERISLTPGFFLVTNPGHIADNDNIYVGTLRTTFRF